jgi:alginate O-acetyltransferase complex protein AlgI
MVFSSVSFLVFFLPCLLVLYFMVPRRYRGARNFILLAFSLAFYACGGPKFLLLMLLSIVINYCCGLLAGPKHRPAVRKAGVTLAAVLGLGLLGWFKYAGFFGEMLHALMPFIPVPQVTLPIGISFFTFQGLSYVIDVFRDAAAVQKNPLKLALYISFFPQLVAGPIVRYTTVADEIDERHESVSEFSAGAVRFLFGLAKKMLLANAVAQIADAAFSAVSPSVALAWLGAVAYTFQIYFDFSAYSDMAIGLGRMFGFHFLENFNYPYVSRSVTEFWRRWHISLSTWFRDYVYIPLGGSRVAAKRRLYFNIFMVWLLTGIWHGAKWTYIVWGMMYFVLLCVERILNLSGQKSWLGWIYTVFFFIAGNVVFRSENVTGALKYLLAMFNIHTTGLLDEKAVYYFAEYKMFLLIGMAAALPIAVWLRAQSGRRGAWIERLRPVWCAAVFLVALSFIVKGGYNPFIYFDF